MAKLQFSWKLLGISALIGLGVGGVISAVFADLSWFCRYGLISKIPQCTNHFVYPLLMIVTAAGIYLALVLLSMAVQKWQSS